MAPTRSTLLLAFALLGGAASADSPAASDAARILADLPGFDFSSLTPQAKQELSVLFTDEFDYCGRPMTLLASVKKGDACKHTRRLVTEAGLMAQEGSSAQEIIASLARYNQTFNSKRRELKIDDRMCLGPKDAPITLAEFSDFECPFCAAARPALESFVKARQGARLCYLPFPLSAHPHAVIAAEAALFARDQGKFWPMHDALFENQLSLSDEFVRGLVKKQGLDVAAFEKAVAAGKYNEEIAALKAAAKDAGVDSTPTVYLNGRKLVLGLAPEALHMACDDELDWVSAKNSWPAN